MVQVRLGRSINYEILNQVLVFVKSAFIGSVIPEQSDPSFDGTPPVGEEDISPALGDPKATCEVDATEIRGHHAYNLWYLERVLARHDCFGHLRWFTGACQVGRKEVVKVKTMRDVDQKNEMRGRRF
jgi:hypothetical protein